MKYIYSMPLFIFITSTISAMHMYLLPDQTTITQRLHNAGFSHFDTQTEIGAQLGHTKIEPFRLCAKVSVMINEYRQSYPSIIATWDHTSKESYPPQLPDKSELLRLLLQEHPKAIETLEKNELIDKKPVIKRRPSLKKQIGLCMPCTNN